MYKVSIDILQKIQRELDKISNKKEINTNDIKKLKKLSNIIKDNYLEIKS